MTRIKYLAYLWAFIITQTGFVCNVIHFLKRHEGESVVLPCETEPGNPEPYDVYLKRTWLHPTEVLFMYTKVESNVYNDDDKNRTSVSGDPSLHLLNVTISQLKASDTDRYYCEFAVENPSSKDKEIPGKVEFFLFVGAEMYLGGHRGDETRTGGLAALPCQHWKTWLRGGDSNEEEGLGTCEGCSGFMRTVDQGGGPCYSSLLYTLPLAVVILLLLLTGFVVIYKCKARKSMMSHLEAPVYEEMVGMKPPGQTQPPVHLEEHIIDLNLL